MSVFEISLVLVLLIGLYTVSAHGPDMGVNAFHQGLNIQITGIPYAANQGGDIQCPEQYCKVGKAGPKGRQGQKGDKGDPAEVCECITNQLLLNKIDNLERLLLIAVSKTARDCQDIQTYFPTASGGVQMIYPGYTEVPVYCNLDEDGHMWTVIQKRIDGSEDFFRGREDYRNGFGNKDSEYWLGLDNIHALTRNNNYKLKVEVEDWNGLRKYAEYSEFVVDDKESDYKLKVGGYSGTAGDSLANSNGQRFSTKDHDVDAHRNNCAVSYKGAWWYNACHHANPNGLYLHGDEGSNAKGISWYYFYQPAKYYSHKSIVMKIRKKV